MKFIKTDIPELIIIEPKVYNDDRGYFYESFRQDKLDEFLGKKINFIQDNESKSTYATLRGLHFQLPPSAQTKLVRVIQGEVLDIAVDIRKNSPTFGKYISVILSGKNKKQFLIPQGFAHGFVTLSKEAIFSYKVDNYYAPDCDRGIAYNDPDIGIDWIVNSDDIILSAKDKTQPLMKDLHE